MLPDRPQAPRTRDLAIRPLGARDRAEAILRALEALRLAWPEPGAANVRAMTVSRLAEALGLDRADAREALAMLDSAGVIERAPRRRRHEGMSEVAWCAVSPSKLPRHVLRAWRQGYRVRSYRSPG